jgi:hypothetical protein
VQIELGRNEALHGIPVDTQSNVTSLICSPVMQDFSDDDSNASEPRGVRGGLRDPADIVPVKIEGTSLSDGIQRRT